jgi:hypothetical protein
MIGPVGRRAVIVLTMGTLALTAACEGQPSVVRGFGSRQLLQLRDTTFGFAGRKQDHIYFVTMDTDGLPRYGGIDLATGAIEDLGDTPPDLQLPLPPSGRYRCEYRMLADGVRRALSVTDTQTGIETVIEGVRWTRPYCPADDDLRIHAWLEDAEGVQTLWRGPYVALQQAPLPFSVRSAWQLTSGSSLVQAARPDEPAAFGLYLVDENELTASEVVPATLAPAAWAEGATPSGSLASASLAEPTYFFSAGNGRYVYPRLMSDGGQTMFLGPGATDTVNELALFRVETEMPLPAPTIEPYNFRLDGVWLPRPAWLFGAVGAQDLRVLHPARAMITTCPWTATSLYGVTDPAGENIAFHVRPDTTQTIGGPLLLVAPSAGAASACRTLAPDAVTAADFSPDGSALYWLVRARAGGGEAELWASAPDGSGARMLGSGDIDGPPYQQPPHFVGPGQLELTLGRDLVWVDVHDDPVYMHYIAEHVFGSVLGLGRWLVTGHDYSDQDDTGKLALINRDTGERRAISPAVAAYSSPDVPPGVHLRQVPETIRIVYLVRGRNPSPQDGVWVATIPGAELR